MTIGIGRADQCSPMAFSPNDTRPKTKADAVIRRMQSCAWPWRSSGTASLVIVSNYAEAEVIGWPAADPEVFLGDARWHELLGQRT